MRINKNITDKKNIKYSQLSDSKSFFKIILSLLDSLLRGSI